MKNELFDDLESQKTIYRWMLEREIDLMNGCPGYANTELFDQLLKNLISTYDAQIQIIKDLLSRKRDHAKALEKMLLEKVSAGRKAKEYLERK